MKAARPNRRPLPGSPAATIKSVATRARVSPSTVSRVFNGTSAVAPDKAARVREAVAELNYQPFGPARALRQQRVHVWSAIVADVQNPFFTAVVRGIEDVAYAHGYRLVLCNSDDDVDKEREYIDIARRERMGGIVLAAASSTDSAVGEIIAAGIPVVAIDRTIAGSEVHSVMVDNRSGARDATLHLLDNGRLRVGCVLGPRHVSTSTERLTGYRDALSARRLPFERSLVVRADYRQEGGYRATRRLLERADPPDALFVANNLMTLGALQAMRDLGLEVPDDVAVVGFDDSPVADLVSPRLTVVSQPTYEIGRAAGELLLEAASGGPPRHVVLSPAVVVRESSARRTSPPPRAVR